MSLIIFFHSIIKSLSLIIFSITHSLNNLNYIAFMLLIIRDKETIDLLSILFIILYFIIYDITRFFSNTITIKINRCIMDHAYYTLSICILSVINLIFSFIFFSYSYIFILIFYRIFISLFNNIAQYIDLPLSLLYARKQFPFKKRNFSFFQKINTFFFFLSFLLFFKYFKYFYIFCFFLSIMNLICFVFSLIILGCNKEKINTPYYPGISERENINLNLIKPYQIKPKNTIEESQNEEKNKNTLNYTDNNGMIINVNNNLNNISTKINNVDNLNKSKQQSILDNSKIKNSSLAHNISLKNKIKLEEQISQNESRSNNSQTLRGFLFPFIFSDSNNMNLYQDKIKIITKLLVLFILSKSLYNISLFLLIFRAHKIKIYSFIDKNNNDLLFSDFSQSLNISSLSEEYLFLFMCFNFLNIFLYFINMAYTSIALKKKFVNYFFYYLSLTIFFVSSIFFIYHYLGNGDNTKNTIEKIRKDTILCFIFNFIMNECTMIMSVFYNIIGKNKGLGERMLKEIKSFSVFFAGILFFLIQSLTVLISFKTDVHPFEKYFYYVIFICFIFIIFLISIILI